MSPPSMPSPAAPAAAAPPPPTQVDPAVLQARQNLMMNAAYSQSRGPSAGPLSAAPNSNPPKALLGS